MNQNASGGFLCPLRSDACMYHKCMLWVDTGELEGCAFAVSARSIRFTAGERAKEEAYRAFMEKRSLQADQKENNR